MENTTESSGGEGFEVTEDLTNLFVLAGEIGREPDLNGLLLKILERSRPWMQADACSIFLPDPESGDLVIHSAQGSNAPQLAELRIPPGRGIVGAAMEEKAIIRVDDVSTDPRFFGVADKKTGYRTKSILAAPLLDSGECVGVIEFLNPIGRDSFTNRDERMVQYFSWLVAAALVKIKSHEADLQHARVQREVDLAKEMQAGLLPTKFPSEAEHPGIDLYATLDPAYEVSGDLYDFFNLPDGRLCFLVGDVADKGVAAGLFMAITRTLIRAIASEEGLDPVGILETVNRNLVPDNSAMLFITIILGFLDTRTGEIVYAQGGHNPPLLVRRGGNPEYEPSGGQPVGVFDPADFGERKLMIMPGDALLVYTDGVTEAMNCEHEIFGEERLKSLFSAEIESAKEATTRVIEAVHRFVGKADQSDDITLMTILRRNMP